MKKALIISLFLLGGKLVLGQSANVVFSDDKQLVINVSLPEVKLVDVELGGGKYQMVLSGNNESLEVGKPNLPSIGSWILVPNGKSIDITVRLGEPEVVENVQLAPMQQPVANIGGDTRFMIDKEAFLSNKKYPGVFAKDICIKDNVKISTSANVVLDADNKLEMITDFECEVGGTFEIK